MLCTVQNTLYRGAGKLGASGESLCQSWRVRIQTNGIRLRTVVEVKCLLGVPC